MRPDIAQSHRFIDVLAGSRNVTFQTFGDTPKHRPLAHILHGSLKQHQTQFATLNAQGAGIFVMVNEGNGKGRTAKNVVRVRTLFIDTDGVPFPTNLPLKPHLIVESSLGKYHVYWLVDGVALADFGVLQEALACHYGTDPSVKDLPRVMRLPGFYHLKGGPVLVQLLEAHDHPPYALAKVYKAWPFLPETLAHKKATEAEQQRQRAEMLRRAAERRANGIRAGDERRRADKLLQAHHGTVASAGEGTRNATLYRSAYTLGGYIGAGQLEPQEVEDALLAAALICGLPEGEAQALIPRAVREGMARPLELDTAFAATPRLDASLAASNQDRATPAKPLLVQSCNDATGRPKLDGSRSGKVGHPRLGGKPCL